MIYININNNNQNNNVNNDKDLSSLFKELQDIRSGRIQAEERKEEPKKEEILFNRILVVNRRFNFAGAIIGILFLIVFSTIIQSNYIFASYEDEKVEVGSFEKNEEPMDILTVISDNISDSTKKEIITKEFQIDYETERRETKYLPLGEENIIQAGKYGYIEKTLIRTYEKGEMIDETVINEHKLSDPVVNIIEVGTSEYMKNMKIHVGDTLVTKEIVYMYSEPVSDEEKLVCQIYDTIDVTFVEPENEFVRVKVDGMEGYVLGNKLTSEANTPGIIEKARIHRVLLNLNPEMELNSPSGFTKEDYKKILSGNNQDVYKIFEDNAEYFYEVEQKYNVNGLFIAAIGIHESNWGTSAIARDKYNLFGYGSYDYSAYESSFEFENYRYGIETLAKVLSKYYLNEPGTPIYDGETAVGSYFNGPTVAAVNIRYASDPNWCNRVYTIMEYLYNRAK